MYYDTTLQTVHATVADFRAAHPLTSYGPLTAQADREAVGLFELAQVPPPHDPQLQAIAVTGAELVGGQWHATYAITPLQLTQEQINAIYLDRFDAALTAHLDATAQARRYDNRITCALRAGYAGPFQPEGQAFAAWMDACNWHAYQVLSGVQDGTLPMPVSVDDFLADMPEMTWPT